MITSVEAYPDWRTCECVLMVAASTQKVVNCSHASVSLPEPNPADAAATALLVRGNQRQRSLSDHVVRFLLYLFQKYVWPCCVAIRKRIRNLGLFDTARHVRFEQMLAGD